MRKIDDSPLYKYFGIVALVLALITGVVSSYSMLVTEPGIKKLIQAESDIHKNYSQAYLVLRDPFVFGLYENFDSRGISVKNSLMYLDDKITAGEKMVEADKRYLEVLLERRSKGSVLGRNSMIFLFIISIAAFAALFFEKKSESV